MEEELDYSKLKYALYARKSTEDETRQVRSIEDQESECRAMARRIGLHIVEPTIVEERSAKKPHKRPLFRQMLNDIIKGKYDAILAWNPDRLARNMLEGGEIIDLVDQGVIKDLKFVTHHFTKDANGKMLLGMAFVLSKQYSDKLSQDVTRGVRRSFDEGKTPTPKHGYMRDKDGFYKPDGTNFDLVVKAWELRKEGVSLDEINEYMNKSGYARQTKTGKTVKMSPQVLGRLFKDPFYYGILIQRDQKVDLRGLYRFTAAIKEETYNAVQQLTYRRIKPNKSYVASFYPLKRLVLCSFCDGYMYIAPSTGGTNKTRYLFARCDNKGCARKKKSIRMINVFNFIYDFLEKGLGFTEVEYDDYYSRVIKLSDQKKEELSMDLHSKQSSLKWLKADIRERSLGMVKLKPGSSIWEINENKIAELTQQQQALEIEIDSIEAKMTNPDTDRLNVKDFLNLSKNAATIVQSANAVVKDQICRFIFLNLKVNEEKVLSYQLKEPFATLLKQRQLSSSRGGRTRTAGLTVPNGAL